MWASAPTNNNARFHDFVGGQSRPPLQMKFDRPFVSSNPVHQISVVPRYFRRGKSSGFANAGRIREIYILRRRGRCLHRPAPCPNRNTPHGADGRYCTGFRFSPLQMRVKNRTGRAKNRRVSRFAPQGRKIDQGMPEARLRHKKERADSVRPQVCLPCCNEKQVCIESRLECI